MKLDLFEDVCVRVSELDGCEKKKKKEEGRRRNYLKENMYLHSILIPRVRHVTSNDGKVGSWHTNAESVTLARPCDQVQG